MQDPGARRSRREPGATGRGPTRPVPRLLRRPRPPRPSRCRVRAPGSLSGAGAEWSLRPRAIVPLSDRRVPTQSPSGGLAFRPCRGGACESGRGKGRRARSVREARAREGDASERLRPRPHPPPIPSLEPRSGPRTQRRVSLAPALWPTALPGSGSDGEVVVSRGPLAERPLARGLPAERQGARQGGLGSGRGSGFPRERSPWRRGRGRGPGAGGWAGRARRASAPSPAEHPCRDGLVQGRPVCAGQQEGWVARVPGGRQAGAARPRTHGGEGSRARGSPLAGKAGTRPPLCGWGAQAGRRGERGGRGAGLAGELARAAVEARLRGRVGRSPGRSRSAGEGRRACHPPRGCVLRRGGAVGVEVGS